MKNRRSHRSAGRGAARAIAAAVLVGVGSFGTARADDPPPLPGPVTAPAAPLPPLPRDVVARVNGKDVTRDAFALALARRLRSEAASEGQSTAATILEVVVRERGIEQEAQRLGITVDRSDVTAEYDRQDRLVRLKTNGAQTLADLLKEQHENIDEFMANLHDYVVEEKIASHPSNLGDKIPKDDNARVAQVLVVVGQIMKKANVERTGLPPGVLVRINGSPITEEDFGKALLLRSPPTRLRDLLKDHCVALFLTDWAAKEGAALTEAVLDREIELEKLRYLRERTLDPRPEIQSVSYEDMVKWKRGRPIEELRKDAQYRGKKALEVKFRARVSDDDVRAEWVRNASTTYGASVFVTDVQASFKIKGALTEPAKRRTREEATRLIADYRRRIESGESADKVLKEIRDKKDPSITAEPKRVQDAGNNAPLFPAVVGLKDGMWSEPVETLSELHWMRRDRAVPAAPFEEIKEDIREDLAQVKANIWLSDQILNHPEALRMVDFR